MRNINEKNKKYLSFIPSTLHIDKLEKYWDESIDNIKENRDWRHYMQCNLFWNDIKKEINYEFSFKNISKYKSLFSSKEFYNFFTYKYCKLFGEKTFNVIVISPISWLYINSYYLKFLSEFDDAVLKNESVQTFFPYMNVKEKYLDSWKNFNKLLKKHINKKYLKIDIKNFYKNINIDHFLYFCYSNYDHIKNDYNNFMWVFNLISYYSENDSFPFLENCPFLSFCSSKLFLRKHLIEILKKLKYKKFIEKIIHYVDDIYIVFHDEWNDNEINNFYDNVTNIFESKNIDINHTKTKYGVLTNDDIEKDITSMDIVEINSSNNKRATYNELNQYLISFSKYIQQNSNKIISFSKIENSINCEKKLSYFVFLDKEKIKGNVNSLSFFQNIDSINLIKMINYKPKYFIYIFDKFIAHFDSKNNPFKLIVKEWENLSKEIQIYYSLIRSFKKMESKTIEFSNVKEIINFRNVNWIYRAKSTRNYSIQNMFFQIFYLYKKSNKYKYVIIFISFCHVILETLNKIKKEICKHIKKCGDLFVCEYLTIINKEERNVCEKIKSYRNNNSLMHANFDSLETTINIDLKYRKSIWNNEKNSFFCWW